MKINKVIILINLILQTIISACKISTPWHEMKSSNLNLEKEVVVGLTYIELGDDSDKNKIFWKSTFELKKKLKDYPGYVGGSIRKEIFGNKGWTMTVWEDEESLEKFVYGERLQTAIEEGSPALLKTKFSRLKVKRKEIPLPWDEVEKILKDSNIQK